ncbi:MAG TPA: DEAD/DEAH box helicase family protein [Planctomycetota bacterium]|jgi:type I restriction enzyme R subunit|nr:DEAD/DEAH box helicase family protein [Planctomycetota bacterium]
MVKPEESARQRIDAALAASGWAVEDYASMNLSGGSGAHHAVAVREFPMAPGYGDADYLLFLGGQAVGVLEAKKEGATLTGVESQAEKYAKGLPPALRVPVRPLPFNYLSNGRQTLFFNLLDPRPRSRRIALNDEIPHIHRPETLAAWLAASPLRNWITADRVAETRMAWPDLLEGPAANRPSTLRSRLRTLPPLVTTGLRKAQIAAVQNLETSLRDDRPRSLLQMATGSGKTVVAVSEVYRLLKYAGAKRVLFLVDRANLGEQAEKEFQGYITPDSHRKFPQLYNIQRLTSNVIAPASAVVITTIQRLYSILRGDAEFIGDEDESAFTPGPDAARAAPVEYNPTLPPETFDVIFVDECHRSIYTLWRQVLEYFDTFLVGLTATPSKLTYGFFNENMVMRYDHARAVADGVNVDYEVWRIRTEITTQGASIEAAPGKTVRAVDKRRQLFRDVELEDDVAYDADTLDRAAANPSQIRTVARAFRDALPMLFPGRTEVPKTLVFCKDDDHAERVVTILREEFGQGNEFARKITYKAQGKPADMIQQFRGSFWPRIAVTVDMVATGTDIRPVEVVLFMRSVRSRLLFEQMKGRGVRICDETEMKSVTPDAGAKTHFVVVDAVGVTEHDFIDSPPLDRAPSVPLKALLDHIKAGGADPDYVSTLAARLLRLAKDVTAADAVRIHQAAGGRSIEALAQDLVGTLDAHGLYAQARAKAAAGGAPLPDDWRPTETQLGDAAWDLGRAAVMPFHDPKLRDAILDARRQDEMLIDEENLDVLLFSGAPASQEQAARTYVEEFETYLATHKAEIDALRFYYSIPQARRPGYEEVKALAQTLREAPEHFTTDRLWRCYAQVRPQRVRPRRAADQLVDVISLVRFAVQRDDELAPYADRVRERFELWIDAQRAAGRAYTTEQAEWLEAIRDHVATSVEITQEDFDATPFAERGGLGAAARAFDGQIAPLLRELNEVLAA